MNDGRLTDATIAGALRAHLPAEAPSGTRRMVLEAVAATPQRRSWLPVIGPRSSPLADLRANPILLVALLLAAVLLAGLAVAGGWRLIAPHRIANGWMAYSTDGPVAGATDRTIGSDLYLVREGGAPILVASRNGGSTRNACPAFSPDGTKLAYTTSSGEAIVIRGVSAAGVTGDEVRLTPLHPGWPMCVRWSADAGRVAYLDGAGRLVVLGLDGSTFGPAPGDPAIDDFARPDLAVGARSPSGERTVRVAGVDAATCVLVVTGSDGTDVRRIQLGYCPYALASWSPDGTRILLMEDVSGTDFTMHDVDLDTGMQSVVVSTVRTNGARSWAGWGDVSWQPVVP